MSWGEKASAQTETEIKNSGDYYWALTDGDSFEEAQEKAQTVISKQIFSIVTHDVGTTSITHNENGQTNSVTETTVRSQAYSNAIVSNLTIRQIADDPVQLFCFITKKSVEEMFDIRKARVLDFVETGRKAEKRLQLDDALRNYYWALIMSRTYNKPIPIELGGQKGDCSMLLPEKIRSLAKDINITVEDVVKKESGGYVARMSFEYQSLPIASLRFRYNTGHSFDEIGIMDGSYDVELDDIPTDKSLRLSFQYQFEQEAKNLNPELRSAFDMVRKLDGRLPRIDECQMEVQLKKGKKGGNIVSASNTSNANTAFAQITTPVHAESVGMKQRIELREVSDKTVYQDAMMLVEDAISAGKPILAKNCFTEDAYNVFKLLFTNTGKVVLNNNRQDYVYVDNGAGTVLARFCYVTLKQDDGHCFADKLVFRFDSATKKITSYAFGLTDKAESDILNKNTDWGKEISKHVILSFMEDYKTAFNLKRHDYISTIFSDSAIIVTGTVLKKKAPKFEMNDGKVINFGNNKKVVYKKYNKQQYLNQLKLVFADNKYVHISFEDNTAKVLPIDNPFIPIGSAFGIQIKQLYASSKYADRGYLTLMLDLGNNPPEIEVRLWQPEDDELVKLNDFFSNKNFPF